VISSSRELSTPKREFRTTIVLSRNVNRDLGVRGVSGINVVSVLSVRLDNPPSAIGQDRVGMSGRTRPQRRRRFGGGLGCPSPVAVVSLQVRMRNGILAVTLGSVVRCRAASKVKSNVLGDARNRPSGPIEPRLGNTNAAKRDWNLTDAKPSRGTASASRHPLAAAATAFRFENMRLYFSAARRSLGPRETLWLIGFQCKRPCPLAMAQNRDHGGCPVVGRANRCRNLNVRPLSSISRTSGDDRRAGALTLRKTRSACFYATSNRRQRHANVDSWFPKPHDVDIPRLLTPQTATPGFFSLGESAAADRETGVDPAITPW